MESEFKRVMIVFVQKNTDLVILSSKYLKSIDETIKQAGYDPQKAKSIHISSTHQTTIDSPLNGEGVIVFAIKDESEVKK